MRSGIAFRYARNEYSRAPRSCGCHVQSTQQRVEFPAAVLATVEMPPRQQHEPARIFSARHPFGELVHETLSFEFWVPRCLDIFSVQRAGLRPRAFW